MRPFIVLATLTALVAVVASRSYTPEEKKYFKEWRKKHNKRYKTHEEELVAMEKVVDHFDKVEAHNKLYDEGKVSFRIGVWEHSDLSSEEKKTFLTGVIVPEEEKTRSKRWADPPSYPAGPASIDWKKHGLVGPIENQGSCSSCWAFSATGVVAGVMRKKHHNKSQFSPQQLVDCNKKESIGCKGGWPGYALEYVRDNGITDEEEYPYVQYDRTCDYNPADKVGSISEVYNVPTRGNETWMKDIVGNVGPVSILICADDALLNYNGGFFDYKDCCTGTNHAVLITGYGTDPKYGDYWIMKNSWGLFF